MSFIPSGEQDEFNDGMKALREYRSSKNLPFVANPFYEEDIKMYTEGGGQEFLDAMLDVDSVVMLIPESYRQEPRSTKTIVLEKWEQFSNQ